MGIELDQPPPDPPLIDVKEKALSRGFASVRRGYDRREVDDFLDTLDSRVLTLKDELGTPELDAPATTNASLEARDSLSAHERVSHPPGERPLGERFGRLVAVVEYEVTSMLKAAEAEAAAIGRDAEDEAERIRQSGQSDARRSIEEARALIESADLEAGAMLSDLTRRRQQMLEGLRLMEQRLVGIARDLERSLDLT